MWLLVTKSIVPSCNPSKTAFLSVFVRKGGSNLKFVSKSVIAASVKTKFAMATEQVTFNPFAFAAAINATDFLVDIVGICNFPPVYSK